MEDGELAEKQARRHVCHRRGNQRGREHALREVALHLLENEDQAGDGGVECRSQTCPRARCDQGTSLTRSGRKPSAHHLSYGGSHLNRRTFPTESQTSTD